MTTPKRSPAAGNRLIHEKSPYLLQHAHNPVDWHPWGDEAFACARKEGKPVFLSIGYSSCHWCHVMERESFESEETAALLNDRFVAIKVDREERPDIDDVYMTATQLFTGSGGWPNSVWLTPDRKPWYAGTYFSPSAFRTMLGRLSDIWRTRRAEVEQQAQQLADAIRDAAAESAGTPERTLAGPEALPSAVQRLQRSFDAHNGGFGTAPKFPTHSQLRLLFACRRRTRDPSALEMITRTLDAMNRGGIHDHVGGGFHRYSTDGEWFLPHFEKMLYDNAQLSRAYVEAFELTRNPQYRRAAAHTFAWVLREMTGDHGGFYSAMDADSEGAEGRYYVWTEEEIVAELGPEDGKLFCQVYGVESDGNFREQATGEKPGTNVLCIRVDLERIAAREKMTLDELQARLDRCCATLLERRGRRARPGLDDKVLTSWNGLMIASLADGGRVLGEPRYVEAARRAAAFVMSALRRDGRLMHAYRDGEAKVVAYLDDYAFLMDGLLELFGVTQDRRWLNDAQSLADSLVEHYADGTRGGFFFTADDQEDLLARTKNPYDAVEPSGNGMAVQSLIRLSRLTGQTRYAELAEHALKGFSGAMSRAPHAATSLVIARAMMQEASEKTQPGRSEAEAPEEMPDAQAQTAHIDLSVFADRLVAAPGDAIELAVKLQIEAGWHVNAHAPLQSHLVPTTLEVQIFPGLDTGRTRYPAGEVMKPAAGDERLSVYQGTVWFRVPLKVKKDAAAGEGEVVLGLRVQACDESRCLSPEVLRVPIRLRVDPSAPREKGCHPRMFRDG